MCSTVDVSGRYWDCRVVELGNPGWPKETRPRKKFDDIFSHLDTIHECDGWTDTDGQTDTDRQIPEDS